MRYTVIGVKGRSRDTREVYSSAFATLASAKAQVRTFRDMADIHHVELSGPRGKIYWDRSDMFPTKWHTKF